MDLSKETADGARNRLVVKIVLGLVAAGIAIGLLMGVAGASAIRALGFKADDPPPAPATAAPTDGAEDDDEDADEPPATPTPTVTTTPAPKEPAFEASSAQVSPGERIEFAGQAPSLGPGATLQVQRREADGEWTDFPVTLETRKGGRFSTWIVTSRTGRWDFRVVGEGFASPTATVEIG